MSEIHQQENATDERAETGGGISSWEFRLVALRYHRAVFGLSRSLLNDEHEAEDVTQEAFLRYWQHGEKVRGPKQWLLTVARNACMDRLRRRPRSVDTEPETLEREADDRGPGWQAQQQELSTRLQEAIAKLSEPQRSLVLLYDVQGLSGADCAQTLGINVNQVKVYLHRARRRLRQELEGISL